MGEEEDIWNKLESEVDKYEPSKRDLDWWNTFMPLLEIGGTWTSPAVGSVFERTGEKELTLKRLIIKDPIKTDLNLKMIRKIGEKKGWKVKIEKVAEAVILYV